jgi:hypothetical protein
LFLTLSPAPTGSVRWASRPRLLCRRTGAPSILPRRSFLASPSRSLRRASGCEALLRPNPSWGARVSPDSSGPPANVGPRVMAPLPLASVPLAAPPGCLRGHWVVGNRLPCRSRAYESLLTPLCPLLPSGLATWTTSPFLVFAVSCCRSTRALRPSSPFPGAVATALSMRVTPTARAWLASPASSDFLVYVFFLIPWPRPLPRLPPPSPPSSPPSPSPLIVRCGPVASGLPAP